MYQHYSGGIELQITTSGSSQRKEQQQQNPEEYLRYLILYNTN